MVNIHFKRCHMQCTENNFEKNELLLNLEKVNILSQRDDKIYPELHKLRSRHQAGFTSSEFKLIPSYLKCSIPWLTYNLSINIFVYSSHQTSYQLPILSSTLSKEGILSRTCTMEIKRKKLTSYASQKENEGKNEVINLTKVAVPFLRRWGLTIN